ncbi:GntR family transcriptional regulator [Microbacterium esteraromaticum]|uniref:GntR family transcriptional regulator n=1 Tax=Microbacterium esteraromaticum TaxID=57043 RepID=UPI001CD20ECE|nr:GntR family transcriptional regulator [Microbacterium esteraromaticum]MCA1307838.1 GntR family transcriptional regulator [Microbacterium esteraromaticum]
MVKQDGSRTLADRIYKLLRSEILDGKLAPGAHLQPAELARRFNASTTVVRDALMQLVGERLCDRRPSYGFFVPSLTLGELEDLTRVRIHSDSLALELAIERGDLAWESRIVSALHVLQATPRRSGSDPLHTTDTWSERHRDFHLALISACNVPLLIDLSATLFDSSELYRRWAAPSTRATTRDVAHEHEELAQAVLGRDAETAGARLAQHYTETMKVVLEAGLVVPQSSVS